MKVHKDLRPLVKAALAAGWSIDRAKKQHVVFIRPDGEKHFTSATPSDHRSYRNLKAELRRAGLEI